MASIDAKNGLAAASKKITHAGTPGLAKIPRGRQKGRGAGKNNGRGDADLPMLPFFFPAKKLVKMFASARRIF